MTQAELEHIRTEVAKLMAKTAKLNAEAGKLNRENFWYPMLIATGLIGTIATASIALSKLF